MTKGKYLLQGSIQMITQTLKQLPNKRLLRILQGCPNIAIYVEDNSASLLGLTQGKDKNTSSEGVLFEKYIPTETNPVTNVLNIQTALLEIFQKYGCPIETKNE